MAQTIALEGIISCSVFHFHEDGLIFRFHELRHSCATIMLYLGYTLKDIQTWLGHSNYNFTADTYIHSGVGVHEQMAQSLSGKLGDIMPQNLLSSPNFS